MTSKWGYGNICNIYLYDRKLLITSEREKTEREIEEFRDQEKKKMKEEMDVIVSINVQDEKLHKAHENDLKMIEVDVKNNKEEAISFLVKALMEVDLAVPDVIVGRFAHKILNPVMQ